MNRKLAALASFCEFHARLGVPLSGLLVMMGPTGRGRSSATSYKPFLAHISKHTPQRRRAITLPAPARRPQILTPRQAQAILDACEHLRNRLICGTGWCSGCSWTPGPGSVKRPLGDHGDVRAPARTACTPTARIEAMAHTSTLARIGDLGQRFQQTDWVRIRIQVRGGRAEVV